MGSFNRDEKRHSGGFSRGGFGGNKSFGGGSKFGGRPEMHSAVCNKCGNDCQVPFKPTGDRPIFCSQCFEKNGGGSERSAGGNFSRPSFRKPSFGGDRQMFQAVCGKCGDKCEVPFRPTEGKPVFCSNCFEKGGSTGGRNTEHYKEQFDIINAKLEKIMKALNIHSAPVQEKKVEKVVEKFEKKPEVKKEVPAKKVVKEKKAPVKKAVAKKKK